MKRNLFLVVVLVAVFVGASSRAAVTVDYGWEDSGTVLGTYGNVEAENVTSPAPVMTGDRSLQLTDMSSSGPSTPQAYVAWVTDLKDGDSVTASFYRYDTTPGAAPSVRIWGHYTSGGIDDYAGSANGNSDYGPGTGWDQASHTWTFDAGWDRTGLVIEARTYSTDGDRVWLDDLQVIAPDHAVIHVVPEPGTIALLGIGALAAVRRRD